MCCERRGAASRRLAARTRRRAHPLVEVGRALEQRPRGGEVVPGGRGVPGRVVPLAPLSREEGAVPVQLAGEILHLGVARPACGSGAGRAPAQGRGEQTALAKVAVLVPRAQQAPNQRPVAVGEWPAVKEPVRRRAPVVRAQRAQQRRLVHAQRPCHRLRPLAPLRHGQRRPHRARARALGPLDGAHADGVGEGHLGRRLCAKQVSEQPGGGV
mmetsp:Transcript_18869/g.54487  ORF Transcript_18869/g.54487 Transcript_18869/m.54487 type:complete len:213 (-) Transcript_18869:794-1432(-)